MKDIHNRLTEIADRAIIKESIAKRGDKWAVTNKSGDRTLGTHDTKKAALKQLAAVEISKKRRSGKINASSLKETAQGFVVRPAHSIAPQRYIPWHPQPPIRFVSTPADFDYDGQFIPPIDSGWQAVDLDGDGIIDSWHNFTSEEFILDEEPKDGIPSDLDRERMLGTLDIPFPGEWWQDVDWLEVFDLDGDGMVDVWIDQEGNQYVNTDGVEGPEYISPNEQWFQTPGNVEHYWQVPEGSDPAPMVPPEFPSLPIDEFGRILPGHYEWNPSTQGWDWASDLA